MSDDELTADPDVDDWIAEHTTSRHAVPLPTAAERVLAAVADAAPLGEVSRLAEGDRDLAASIARLACSAAYTGNAGERVSLPYALMRLGRDGVRCVTLTAVLAPVALRAGPLEPLRRHVWRECIASAVTCQAAAISRGLRADDAYLAGLMHDFGKIVALTAAEARTSLFQPSRGVDYWMNAMERHHCDAGWVMTELWRLPESVQSITARHHLPEPGDALHEIVQTVDRVVATAVAARWQISADQIGAVHGVRSADEAMALRIGLARHAFFFANIGEPLS